MKATINGVTIEGTPQEISEYQLLMGKQAKPAPVYPIAVKPIRAPWESPYDQLPWTYIGTPNPYQPLTVTLCGGSTKELQAWN